MATQFSIDDAFVLEGEEEGTASDGEAERQKSRDRDGEMTFGPLSFSKAQTQQPPAAAAAVEHSSLKYQASSARLFRPHAGLKLTLSSPVAALESGK